VDWHAQGVPFRHGLDRAVEDVLLALSESATRGEREQQQ
jgi:hypothetical protein